MRKLVHILSQIFCFYWVELHFSFGNLSFRNSSKIILPAALSYLFTVFISICIILILYHLTVPVDWIKEMHLWLDRSDEREKFSKDCKGNWKNLHGLSDIIPAACVYKKFRGDGFIWFKVRFISPNTMDRRPEGIPHTMFRYCLQQPDIK